MNRLELQELEGTLDRAKDALAAFRSALPTREAEAKEPMRNALELEFVRDDLRRAFRALDTIELHIGHLRCDVVPCDRVDGICPKCERPPL